MTDEHAIANVRAELRTAYEARDFAGAQQHLALIEVAEQAAEIKRLHDLTARAAAEITRLRAALAAREWQPIESAPRDGSEVLLYRPLAQKSNDPVVTLRKTTPYQSHVWEATIPPGCDGKNFTEGACYATHWQPLPDAPVSV